MLRALAVLTCLFLLGVFFAGAAAVFVFYNWGQGLPNIKQLAEYDPPVMSRMYAGDGRLIEEYAVQGRVFVPIEAIPKRVINAFLAAEDKTFYSHPGVDITGLIRASWSIIDSQFTGRRMIGASTITQQVAKNFLIGDAYSFDRKIRELILALRIEQTFSKDHILELYLNDIYLGQRSYGVAAAAMNYFNKSLDELTIAEAAYLAGANKGPANYHPVRNSERAQQRRNYVINRMVEDGHISEAQARLAKTGPVVMQKRQVTEFVDAGEYFAEEVRRELVAEYGSDKVYQEGLSVRTSLDPFLQDAAERALKDGLMAYDRRHGWRGRLGRLNTIQPVLDQLMQFDIPPGAEPNWRLAGVTASYEDRATVTLEDGRIGSIGLDQVKWARAWQQGQELGPPVRAVNEVLGVGDIILVERDVAAGKDTYTLRQIPNVEGALVALNPHTGRVLALKGGLSFDRSQFNRATQARRQPGSAFKPFVYLAALDAGFTPATMVLDAPFVIDQGPGLPKWKPKNYSGRYYGPSTLRTGIERSQNLMTVRLAQAIGMERISETAERFGLFEDMSENLSNSLGAQETTLLELTAAYAMLVNGGKQVTPTFIDRIQDRNGNTINRADDRTCVDCAATPWQSPQPPNLPDQRAQVADPASVYQVVSMLEGVVLRGTGRRVRDVGKPLAGKTGTSNESFDTWFIGFSPDLVAGVFVGFDEPQTLGPGEGGASVASPIFRDFMAEALDNAPSKPFRIPAGLRLVRINTETGLPARPGDRGVILEAFKPGTVPERRTAVIGGVDVGFGTSDPANAQTQPSAGGLY